MRIINPGCHTPRGAVRLREVYGDDGMFTGWTFAVQDAPLEPYWYGWMSPDGQHMAGHFHMNRKEAEQDLLDFSPHIG